MLQDILKGTQTSPPPSTSTELEHVTQAMYLKNKELTEKNKILSLLREIDETFLARQTNPKAVSQRVVDLIATKAEFPLIGLMLVIPEGRKVALFVSSSQEKLVSIAPEFANNFEIPLSDEASVVVQAIQEKQEKTADRLSLVAPHHLNPGSALKIQTNLGIKCVVISPLVVGNEVIGVMLIGLSDHREHLSLQDADLVSRLVAVIGIALDNILLNQKLKDANEYLAQLDKMKDEFISMASHELNTPLAAIEGYLSMILDEGMGGKIDAKTREYLNRAYDSSKRLAELIMDLLNVSRIEQGRLKMKFSECNLYELAESVIHELQIKADSKKIYLKLAGDKAKVPMTWCDPDRIREIFVNLAGNALKFTDQGGVTIMVEAGEGGTVRGTVADTGRGIAKEDQKKLFQKFSQVKREIDEHQGTGLGLYISKNFVELHKGRIWVESEAGKGAKFIFELPVLTEEPKELAGAILEKPINAPQIETGTKDVPQIVTDSSKSPV